MGEPTKVETFPKYGDSLHIGDSREDVLSGLSQMGYCGIPQPGGRQITFQQVEGAALVTLTFTAGGRLEGVELRMMGE